MAERPFLYRFTRDLRLDDHAGLAAAASHGTVLPVLVIDAAMKERFSASPLRAAFFCAAVGAVDAELRERGSRLVIRRGDPVQTIIALVREVDAAGVAWAASYDAASMETDRRLQSVIEEANRIASIVHDAPAVPPEESAVMHSADGLGYRAFVPYFQAWCELPIASHEYPLLLRFAARQVESDPLPAPGEFGAECSTVSAGPAVAQHCFDRFLREDAAQYAAIANVPAADRTSHLSSHLSFGSISVRTIVRAVRARLADPFSLSEERLSLRFFLRALAQRDFFLQLSWFHPRTRDEPLQEKMRGFAWADAHPALEAWRTGTTGYPLVDAGIRQLHATGWMHPRVRAVAASWLCFDLGVDWRVGRRDWDRWLIEDDPSLATGNWQWIAGVGADMAQYPRIYNPERQRRRYDPAAVYVRRWIPELRDVPMESRYGRAADSRQLGLALYSQTGYPKPALDHGVAARAFLRRYREFRAAEVA
jgi:deoxyribodipyrimidine photo-lyase